MSSAVVYQTTLGIYLKKSLSFPVTAEQVVINTKYGIKLYKSKQKKLAAGLKVKGIDRSFELRGEIRLIRSVMINWRLGNFFYFILKGHHHKISKKPIDAA